MCICRLCRNLLCVHCLVGGSLCSNKHTHTHTHRCSNNRHLHGHVYINRTIANSFTDVDKICTHEYIFSPPSRHIRDCLCSYKIAHPRAALLFFCLHIRKVEGYFGLAQVRMQIRKGIFNRWVCCASKNKEREIQRDSIALLDSTHKTTKNLHWITCCSMITTYFESGHACHQKKKEAKGRSTCAAHRLLCSNFSLQHHHHHHYYYQTTAACVFNQRHIRTANERYVVCFHAINQV